MKKISLLSLCFLFTFMMCSAQLSTSQSKLITELPAKIQTEKAILKLEKIQVSSDLSVHSSNNITKRLPVQAKSANAEIEVQYTKPYGAYYNGIEDGQGWYKTLSLIEVAQNVDFYYLPWASIYENTTFSWVVERQSGNITLPQNSSGVATQSLFGLVNVPVLTGTNGTNTASYQFRANPNAIALLESTAGQYNYAADETGTVKIDGFAPMSMADPAFGVYGGFNDIDFHFGTGQKSENGVPLNSVISLFDKPMSPLYVKNIQAFVSQVDASRPVIPDGVELTLNLYKVVNNIITSEVLGSAKATPNDVHPVTPGNNIFTIDFNFTEISGGFQEIVTLTINDTVAVSIENVDNANLDMIFAPSDEFGGTAFFTYGDELSWFGFEKAPAYNYHIVMNAAFPVIEIDENNSTVVFPVGGGEGNAHSEGESNPWVLLYSSLPLQEDENNPNIYILTSEVPDWIDIAVNEELFEDYGVIGFFFTANSQHRGRQGEIIIRTHADVYKTVKVIQGDGGSGFSNPTISNIKVITLNNAFELSYTTDFNTATIYNISGQAVATYELPSEGKLTVSTDNLSKGTYIVKFTGKATETVKVVR